MIYRIVVPAERVAVAKDLLTARELKDSIKDGHGLIVRLGLESDARAFTEMLRDSTGAVIGYTVED